MVTFSLYGFWWGFRLAQEANDRLGGSALNVRKHARLSLIGLFVHLTAFIGGIAYELSFHQMVSPACYNAAFVFALVLSLYFLWLLVMIARMLRTITGQPVPKTWLVIVSSFFWMLSLPLLQSHLNKVVGPNSA